MWPRNALRKLLGEASLGVARSADFSRRGQKSDFHKKSFSIVGNLYMFLKTQRGETKGISGTYLV